MLWSPSNCKIHFFFQNVHVTLRNRKKLKEFIELIFKREKKRLKNVNYIFCTDHDLLETNRRYLKHDFFTDILTFDLSDSSSEVIGDIYLSLDRIKENAKTYSKSNTEEMHRVIFHGALHLCGYDDKSRVNQHTMRAREDFYLREYFKRFT